MARGCLGSGCAHPLTFTEWPIAPRHPPREKFKRAQIHRGKAAACGLTHALTSLRRPQLHLCALQLSLRLLSISITIGQTTGVERPAFNNGQIKDTAITRKATSRHFQYCIKVLYFNFLRPSSLPSHTQPPGVRWWSACPPHHLLIRALAPAAQNWINLCDPCCCFPSRDSDWLS
ncbi:unnamed protein product [Pleuronectes platessa]|uniref:Uncharacterized protein n=1 Tax=Pleuronectes platessa TaxID=8262 RepID=A0A9N7V7H5_PLEPL|nr:unnamed protein product [Pleuronectes platessa]